jgi:hypothetical protein
MLIRGVLPQLIMPKEEYSRTFTEAVRANVQGNGSALVFACARSNDVPTLFVEGVS